ncbi:MAG: 50S ribosomal protein L9 [Candidatus Omnitrophota bacterium]|jgi:large subunit ribosomal protein L9|nr:MAG: 50S ribosomal protein L9 [Candidatus Omnitrophota bacterium]
MKVILIEDVKGLGKAGNRVDVKDGYAHNYLLPKKIAIHATAGNVKKLEQAKQKELFEAEKTKKEAETLKVRLEGLSVTIPMLTQEEDKEKLYGSVSVNDLVNSLKEEGIIIEKSAVILEQPLKALGIYEVIVRLHPEVQAKVKVWIVQK